MSKVRWGLIGCGRIANAFALDMVYVENARLEAVAARKQADAQTFATRYDIPRVYGGYDHLFNDPDIDAVYIATPHSVHRRQMEAALNAGKAVLCEKPFTVTPEETEAVRAVWKGKGLYLKEAMWTWFLPAIKQAKAWIDAGRIGTLRHIKADFGYPLPYDPNRREYDNSLGGGCLLEMGIYPVALTWLLKPEMPTRTSVHAHLADNGVEDDVSILFDYGDVLATLATSFRCKLINQAELIGDRGTIVIPDFWRANTCSLFHIEDRIDHFEDKRTSIGFEYQIRAASEDILAGRTQSKVVTLDDSLAFQTLTAQVRAHIGASR